jgi:signal transduction histidine kinase
MLMFAWARRIPRSLARDLALTLAFNLMVASVFTLFSMLFSPASAWGRAAWVNIVVANCIGFVIHAEFALAGRWIGPRSATWTFAQRALFFTAVPLVGVFVGYAIAFHLLDWDAARRTVFSPSGIASVATLSILISGILALILGSRERAARAEAAFESERARVATAERSAALAQLKALEAQVEPHFLYNTLAHVVSLVDREPATAKRMIERLIVLLRAAASGGGASATTLAEQVDHARAYLDLVALRMGPRLAWSIDLPPALAARQVPPSILLPLVENAIKHGIEPQVAGGALSISARARGERLELEVADTGAGFGSGHAPFGGSTGLGLANLRARLAALHGDEATLAIVDNVPTGVRVRVTLPPEPAHA